MAIVRRTLSELRQRPLGVDWAKVDATTEADIERHMIEDGEDPAVEYRLEDSISPAVIRKRLGMSQPAFADALMIPVATLRNWEQGRTVPDPAARSLMRAVAADAHQVFALIHGRTEAAE
ncbi:MAG: helix-turn-helix domain-containing protein [Ancalomicrobiaceae bacterium]|nr:helix-turn-helix domain-containing protein [Ancalomicrobiaceae bacterium]